MGDFLGHVVAGTFLWLTSLWWTTNVIWQHFRASRLGGKRYQAHFYYADALSRPFPLESAVKVVVPVTLIWLEFGTGYKDGEFINNVILQHVTMHFAFVCNGVLDVVHHRLGAALNSKQDMDRGMQEPLGALLPMATLTFLFHFHLHGRTLQDTLVHLLFVLATVVVIACIIVETWRTSWVTCSVVRVIAMQTCSTWLIQIGFTLYPDYVGWHMWDGNDPMQCQFVLLMFFLHWIGNIGFTLLLSIAIRMHQTSNKA